MAQYPKVIAFKGDVCIASGELPYVALVARNAATRGRHESILIFDAATSETLELDLRGSREDVLRRLPAAPAERPQPQRLRRRGRPKLGVVGREVTLLPRHWHWLASQPGSASVALRKLVEHGMRANAAMDRVRTSQNAAYRFMSVMAGDRAGFEDAARALFAGDAGTFNHFVAAWPADICSHVKALAADALRTGEKPE